MNLEKHPKNLLHEWMEEEESLTPAHSRNPRVLRAHVKIGKPVGSKGRPEPPHRESPVDDAALRLREPGPPPKLDERSSPLASFEHQQRVSRLPRLRAPFAKELRRPTPAPAQPAPRPPASAGRPRSRGRTAGRA